MIVFNMQAGNICCSMNYQNVKLHILAHIVHTHAYCTYSRTLCILVHAVHTHVLYILATGRRPLPRSKSYGFSRFVQPPPATQAAYPADEIRSSVRFSLKPALPPRRNRYSGGEIAGVVWATCPRCGGAAASPSPLWGRVGVGGREVVARRCSTRRPPPPTPPQPNLAIARVRPLNKVTEVGNSRLRLGEGRDFAAPSQRNLARRA